ncbi:MAG: hypothetical protein IPJ17_21470 [Holophagales bacterium]|nr:MAG: hypothetical protein IPJ17_21470 [Holophagales bacterium]
MQLLVSPRPRVLRLALPVLFAASAWIPIAAFSAAAHAATAVVPTDYATIQAAVNAVQGTSDALVRIDSNDTFVETVVAQQSVRIEGGLGFLPTLRAGSGACVFARPCALSLRSSGNASPVYRLSGLRLLPAATGGWLVEIYGASSATLAVTAERLTIEDPDNTGATSFHLATNTGAAANTVTIRDSEIQLGGSPEYSAQAILASDRSFLTLERLRLTKRFGSSSAVSISGEHTVVVRDCVFDIWAPDGPYLATAAFLGGTAIDARFERNLVRLHGSDLGFVDGIQTFAASGGTVSVVADANQFLGGGGRVGTGFETRVAPGGHAAVLAVNNLFRNLSIGLSLTLDAASGLEGAPIGGTGAATWANNTIADSGYSGLSLEIDAGAEATMTISSNLVVRSGGYGVGLADGLLGVVTLAGGHNGFFGNQLGDVQAPLTLTDSVVDDPLFVSGDDLHLRTHSPMLDAGDNNPVINLVTDLDGNPRIQNGTVDIGAYEGAVGSLVEVPTLDAIGLGALVIALGIGGWLVLGRRAQGSLSRLRP